MFGNDHLLWMLESYLEAKRSGEEKGGGGGDDKDVVANEGAAGRISLKRQTSSISDAGGGGGKRVSVADYIRACVEESMRTTVEGVYAEEWPDLSASVLSDEALLHSLK